MFSALQLKGTFFRKKPKCLGTKTLEVDVPKLSEEKYSNFVTFERFSLLFLDRMRNKLLNENETKIFLVCF